jgi:preprotein translocase subunit SecA
VAEAIPLQERKAAANLSYRSGGGSASYAVGATASTTTTDDQGRQVEKRDDGSTVRRVASGNTYTADEKVGRNDPCPCGSGKKFKRCHGA